MAGPDEALGVSDSSKVSLWSQSNTVQRVYHRGVALAEGGFMIAGGQNQAPAVTVFKQPAIFDVEDATVNPDGSKTVDYRWERLLHTVTTGAQNFGLTRIGDEVYFTGGHEGRVDRASDAMDRLTFRRSPAVNLFASFTMPFRVASHGSCGLASGKLLLAGGFDFWNLVDPTTRTFDMDNGWVTTGNLNVARLDHHLAEVSVAGGVLAIGGRIPVTRPSGDTDDTNYYNLDTDTASVTDDSIGGLDLNIGAATFVNGGQCYKAIRPNGATIVSSAGAEQTALNTNLLGDWTVEGWMTNAAGTVIACGGSGAAGAANNLLFAFGIDADTFFIEYQHGVNVTNTIVTGDIVAEEMPWPHSLTEPGFYHFAIVKTNSGVSDASFRLYVNGSLVLNSGTVPRPEDGSAALLRVGSDPTGVNPTFGGLVDEVRISKVARSATEVLHHWNDQKGMVYWDVPDGDWRSVLEIGKCTEVCELRQNDGSWVRTGSMAYARFGFGYVTLPDGRVAVFGGYGYRPGDAVDPEPLDSCEVWDPRTGFWQSIPDMSVAREFAQSTYVPDLNAVVVTGGEAQTSCDILNLESMTWKRGIGSLGSGLYRSVAGLVDTGFVVSVGGSLADDVTLDHSTVLRSYLLVPNAEEIWDGGLNRMAEITAVPSATSLQFETDDIDAGYTLNADTDAIVTAVKSSSTDVPGPYVFDPKEGAAITGTTATIDEDLENNRQYGVLELRTTPVVDEEPALRFPDEEGYLVFAFGNADEAVYPVRYFGRISETELKLDYSFKFPNTVPAGSSVRLLAGREPFTPESDELVGGVYATASAAGRIAALFQVDQTVAAGVLVNKKVAYPGDRGLGGEGYPDSGNDKLSDRVAVWGGDDLTAELKIARES